MDRIARATERDLPYGDWLLNRVESEDDVAASVAQGAVGATYRLGPEGDRRRRRAAAGPRGVVSALRPRGADPGDLAADRDRAPAEPALRGPLRLPRTSGGDLRELLDALRRDRPREGVAKPGDLIADHGRPPGPGRSARTCSRCTGSRSSAGALRRAGARRPAAIHSSQARLLAAAQELDEDVRGSARRRRARGRASRT